MNCNPNECRESGEGHGCQCSADISRAVLADRIIQALLVGMVLVFVAEAIAKGFA